MGRSGAEAVAVTIKVSYRKADYRYYVSIDGEKVGWVTKLDKGEWIFYACVRDSLRGERLSIASTRRDAVMEGISNLEIYHRGWLVRLNMETVRDEEYQIDPAKLRALWDQMLDEKYPAVAKIRRDQARKAAG